MDSDRHRQSQPTASRQAREGNLHKILALTGALLISVASFGTTAFQPTTTLAQETGNNTNLTSSFTGTTNGDVVPGNISKVDIHTLLYTGESTKVFAHYMPWWGGSGHVSIGLGNEATPAVVNAQVADAISRGIDGFIVDWYGPQNTHHNTATLNVKAAAEASTSFEFAICEDSGSLKGASDVTTKLLSDIQYMADNYFSSPRYWRWNGRPVVSFFLNTSLAIDWATVRAQAAGNPVFIFRNSSGFTDTDSDGSFAWTNVSSNVNDMGLSSQDSFYKAGIAHPSLLTIGSAYKGFNDTIASWGSNRIKNQQCGQTWLAIWAEAGKYYSSAKQLTSLQIATWNDYEEGTEVESGIDNCVTISAALSGSTLGWTITGQESTIDHYTVFASQDGVNLMAVAQVAAGTHAADLSALGLPAGSVLVLRESRRETDAAEPHVRRGQLHGGRYREPASGCEAGGNSGQRHRTGNRDRLDHRFDLLGRHHHSPRKSISVTERWSQPPVLPTFTAARERYTVTATATGSNGMTGTAQQKVTVAANKPPVVALSVSPASGTAPLSVTASTAGSTAPNGSIASTSIDFGDGTVVRSRERLSCLLHRRKLHGEGHGDRQRGCAGNRANLGQHRRRPPRVRIPGSTVTAPLPNSTVSNPVKFMASAKAASSTAKITAMKIYVDYRVEVLGERRQHQHDFDAQQRFAPHHRAGLGFDWRNLQELLHHHGEVSLRAEATATAFCNPLNYLAGSKDPAVFLPAMAVPHPQRWPSGAP